MRRYCGDILRHHLGACGAADGAWARLRLRVASLGATSDTPASTLPLEPTPSQHTDPRCYFPNIPASALRLTSFGVQSSRAGAHGGPVRAYASAVQHGSGGGTATRSSHPKSDFSSGSAGGDALSGADGGSSITDGEWSEVVGLLGRMAARKHQPNAAGGWRDAFEFMPTHMERAGLTPERLACLNFIHVAGTKGKGSTCAMVESVLRSCGYRTALFTSPHLVDVRERIRVDGAMLPRAEFAASFRRVHGRLSAAADADTGRRVGMPSFFAFMTLMALDAFLSRPPGRAPHVVVLEVGIGGRLDATNGVTEATRGSALAAAAVTSLGFDHMELLGDTLPKIAREKAGIMKAGRPVIVAPQPADAMGALQEVAAHVGARLVTPPPLERYRLAPGPLPPLASAGPSPLGLGLGTQGVQHASDAGEGEDAAGSSRPAPASRPELQPQSRSQSQQPLQPSDPHPEAGPVVGLGGEHMRLNASLAVALAAEWEAQYARAATAAAAVGAGAEPGAVAAAVAAAAGRPVALAPGGPSAAAAAARAAAVAGGELPSEYAAGLRSVRWPGRSQVIVDEAAAARGGRLTWYLDGAHTPESMATCAAWFGQELARRGAAQQPPEPQSSGAGGRDGVAAVLLFGCMRDRDPAVLLPALAAALAAAPPPASVVGAGGGGGSGGGGGGGLVLVSAVFTPMLSGGGTMLPAQGNLSGPPQGSPQPSPPLPSSPSPSGSPTEGSSDLSWQERMRSVWASTWASSAAPRPGGGGGGGGSGGDSGGGGGLAGLPAVWVAGSLPAALEAVRGAAAADPRVAVHVLVTGSLYLVGDTLRLLGKPPA